VVPLGALEQHGHHLPLLTDSLLAESVVSRAAQLLADEALFLPVLWLGASDHHLAFPGTVSLPSELYADVIVRLIESLIQGGFRRIFLLNAHAGNITPAESALMRLAISHRTQTPDLMLAFSSWFDLAAPELNEAGFLHQTHVIHACEWETSGILADRPELVGDDRQTTSSPRVSAYFSPDFTESSLVFVPRTIDQASPVGAFGRADLATPEKGSRLLEIAANAVVRFVREFRTWPPHGSQRSNGAQ
jgi:creatinine amidohydrolase